MLGSGSSNSKLVVLLASVLKPVDDTRMREKFAETLRLAPNTEVHVAGRNTTGEAGHPSAGPTPAVQQHAIFWGYRLSFNRLLAQLRFARLLRRLRPAIVFVHAPELLPLTLLWQRLGQNNRLLVYDIRENYALNIRTQRVYQGLTRRLLASCLRWVEALAARRAAAVILAEASYADELPFLAQLPTGRVLLLENKYQPAPEERLLTIPRPAPEAAAPLRLLFSGTISELNGVREALSLTRALGQRRPAGAHLTLIGFCQQPELLRELEHLAATNPGWLTLVGGAEPVPHRVLIAALSKADWGLLPYRPHPSTARCRPTKLFEYLAHGLPVLVPDNPLWAGLVRAHGAGLIVDFEQPAHAAAAIIAGAANSFYPRGVPPEALWESEAKKLRHLLESLR